MANRRLFPWMALVLFFGIFGIVSLACDLPFNVDPGSTPTPTAAPLPDFTPLPKAAACLLPDLVGLDQKAAESALSVLDLVAEKQVEMSQRIPAGVITRQEPAAGTRLEPCQGKVSVWVSGGAGASQSTPTRTGASPTPPVQPSATAAQPSPTAGPKLANPAAYDTLYSFFFPSRTYGFDDVLWDVKPSPDAKVLSKEGKLSVLGRVEAYAAEATYNQLRSKTRVLLSGGVYGLGLKEFTLVFNRSRDGKKYLALGCADQAQGAAGLVCDLYSGIDGKETLLPNTRASMCTGKCSLELELTETNVLVYANAEQKIAFKNNLSIEGTIGLRIDNPSATPYTLDAVVVYAVPPAGEAFGVTQYREDFGDEWAVGKQDNEFAIVERSIADWVYRWIISAKQSAFSHSFLTNLTLPDLFGLSVNVIKASGPADAAYGVTFRCQDNKNFYYFAVRDEGTIAIYANENGKWVELLKKTKVSGIKPGAENRLSIAGSGSQYTFSINDQQVAKLNDTRFKGGGLGLVVELAQAGQAALVNFNGVSLERFQP